MIRDHNNRVARYKRRVENKRNRRELEDICRATPEPPFSDDELSKHGGFGAQLSCMCKRIVEVVCDDLGSRKRDPITFNGDVVDALCACSIILVGSEDQFLHKANGGGLDNPLRVGADASGNPIAVSCKTVDEVLFQLHKIYTYVLITRSDVKSPNTINARVDV